MEPAELKPEVTVSICGGPNSSTPILELRLATAHLHPDRITGHAPRNRIIAADQPIREFKPDVHRHRLIQLVHVGPAGHFLQRRPPRTRPTPCMTTTHERDRMQEHRRKRVAVWRTRNEIRSGPPMCDELFRATQVRYIPVARDVKRPG